MQPTYSFDKYQLLSVSYARPEVQKTDDQPQAEININIEVAIQENVENTNLIRSRLTVSAQGPFEAEIILYGYFSSNFTKKPADWLKEIQVISASCLLPIARSILASISSQDGETPFLIPTVNFNTFFDNAE